MAAGWRWRWPTTGLAIALFLACAAGSIVPDGASVSSLPSANLLPGDTSRDLGEWLAEVLHDFPHISYKFQLVADRWNPNENDYLQAVSSFAVPFCCLGALFFVIGLGYAVFRCARVDKENYRFKKWHRSFLRITLVLLTLAMMLACGPGIWASVEVAQTVPFVSDRVQESANFLVLASEAVNYSVVQLSDYLNSSYPELTSAVENSLTLQNDLNDYKDPILTTELVRNIVSICVYGGIVIACTFGLLAAVFGWGTPAMMMAVMLWLLLSFSWLLCGVSLSIAVTTGDYCETGDSFFIYNYFADDNTSISFAEYYMHCNSSSPYEQLESDGIYWLHYANASYYKALAENNTEEAAKWLQVRDETSELLLNLFSLNYCASTNGNYVDANNKICSDGLVGLTTMVGMWIIIGLLGCAAIPVGIAGFKQFPAPQWYEEFGAELVLTREEKNYYSDLPPINTSIMD